MVCQIQIASLALLEMADVLEIVGMIWRFIERERVTVPRSTDLILCPSQGAMLLVG